MENLPYPLEAIILLSADRFPLHLGRHIPEGYHYCWASRTEAVEKIHDAELLPQTNIGPVLDALERGEAVNLDMVLALPVVSWRHIPLTDAARDC